MTELLRITDVYAGYGHAVVLEGITLALEEGEALAVLGRNGAGKTTLVATLMGHTRLHRGELRWRRRDLGALSAHRRAAAGIGWVPQEREIFRSLTVDENLTVAARPGPWNSARVYRLFPRLAERRTHYGNQLSGGEQQMLAVGRALTLNPCLMLLDEPLEGLAPVIADELILAIRGMIDEEGLSIILVEQHADTALSLTQRAVVLERGRIVHRAQSAELARDPAMLQRLVGIPDTRAEF